MARIERAETMTNARSMHSVKPGGTLGILGGGQLGRMIALSAAEFGLKVHVYAPDPDSPAFGVAAETTVAPYDDATALAAFAASVDVVTYEFENIPHETAAILAGHAPLRPSPQALLTTQDRLVEKRFVNALGIPTAPFRPVDSGATLAEALETIGRPAVLKTRRFGYDGKGQRMIRAGSDPEALISEFAGVPCILEGFVHFEREISVVAARGVDGRFAAFDPCANEHRDHILSCTRVPAPGLDAATAAAAIGITRSIADALDYVGVIAVEMFEIAGPAGAGRLVVNEIAPRVHNSGHWTIEGALTSQFDQCVRAVCGWPLGDPSRIAGVVVEMHNLIGAEAENWFQILSEPGSHLHLYGKDEARPGRKMGHVTRLIPVD